MNENDKKVICGCWWAGGVCTAVTHPPFVPRLFPQLAPAIDKCLTFFHLLSLLSFGSRAFQLGGSWEIRAGDVVLACQR